MTWLTWLGLAVILTAIVAVNGIQPRGTRPVARTHLMGVARFALAIIAVIVAYLALRGRIGG